MSNVSKVLERARQLMKESSYDAALCEIQAAIFVGPPDARTYLAAAICHAELGSPDIARSELEVALALDDTLRHEIVADVRLASL